MAEGHDLCQYRRYHEQLLEASLDVKVGDLILFGKYSGQEIKLDGQEYLIMKEDDVLAVSESTTHHKPVGDKGKIKKKLIVLRGKTKNKKH